MFLLVNMFFSDKERKSYEMESSLVNWLEKKTPLQ